MILPDEIDNPLLAVKRKHGKVMRRVRREQVRLRGKAWTREERARHTKMRKRAHCTTERRKELLDTFRKALEKIDKVIRVCLYAHKQHASMQNVHVVTSAWHGAPLLWCLLHAVATIHPLT